jgi:ferredoxin
MKVNGKSILLCDCEGTMDFDAKSLAALFDGQDVVLNTHLCRSQIENFSKAVSDGEPMIVACTQEAPLFIEVAAETGGDTPISFANIRERAGWSDEAKSALPKIKALISEATLDAPLTTSVVMNSGGAVLVYGSGQETLEIARQLADRLEVTCLLDGGGEDILPPRLMDVPIFIGHIASLSGHLGAFEAVVDGYAPPQVSSRASLNLSSTKDGVTLSTDLVLDLSGGEALVPAPEKRDGYLHPDPGNPALVQKALFDLIDLVGEFEKPRYIAYDSEICVHARSAQIGCTRCIDVCPTNAITPNNEEVEIDPYICAGCGACASVCPTGAAKYQLPAGNFLFERVKLLLGTYREAGGTDPVLLVHDTKHGEDMISAMSRAGRGLPANVLPFAVNEVTQIGFDFMAVALGYGAAKITMLTGPGNIGETDGLESQRELVETVTSGLGYGAGRVEIVDHADPDALADYLYQKEERADIEPGSFIALGGKREIANLALNHLHEYAPEPVDILPLPAAAPFGTIEVNTSDCTLCLSCVSACPTGALKANPDSPQFTFTETTCVQCGLCRTICPESVITLVPRFNFTGDARSAMVVKEEEPFACIKCGEPFGVKSSIDQIVEKLSEHSMFPDEKSLDRIKMCPDCRVFDVFDEADTPMVGGARPKTVTTEDYLKERENLREEAREFMQEHGLDDADGTDES